MASGTSINPFGERVTITQTDTTYINTASCTYVLIGKLVVFSATFVTKVDISSSVSGVIRGLPNALYRSKRFAYDTQYAETDFSTDRYANVVDTYMNIKGPFTAGRIYTVNGAYIAE